MASEPAATIVSPAAGGVLRERRTGPHWALWAFTKARPLGAICGFLLVLVLLIAIFADRLAPYQPNVNSIAKLKGPSSAHLLGTDNFGRDMLSRILYGSRISIKVGMLSMSVAMVVSMALGITSAYFKGWWDYFVSRVVEVVQALPGIVLLIALLTIFSRSVTSIGIVLGLSSGLIGSRVTRAATFNIASQQYVESARALGCTATRIVIRYLVPNVFPVVIVLATINIGAAIIAEASLSFIGFGVPPPAPSWGGMLASDGRRFMVAAPWLFYAPAVALAVVVFCVNMFGDALRDRLDPRLRGGT